MLCLCVFRSSIERNEKNQLISRQIGAKRVDFEPRGSGRGAPCQTGWPCHLRKQENARQQSGTVAPCRFNSSRLIVIWRCNLESSSFFSHSLSLENGDSRFLVFIFGCSWFESFGLKLIAKSGRLSFSVNRNYVPLPFSFCVLIQS